MTCALTDLQHNPTSSDENKLRLLHELKDESHESRSCDPLIKAALPETA